MAKTRLTIKDIARLSGVGKSTVSRVLNNETGVSDNTRQKVETIIAKHHFTPSKSARAMRGLSDKVVGIIVSRFSSDAENQAVQGMLPLLLKHGYDPILIESQFDSTYVRDNLKMLRQRNVDGVILFAFTGLDINLLNGWQDRLVIIARNIPSFSSINYDDQGSIQQLMHYLVNHNHINIGFIGVNLDDETTGRLRWQAYQDYCQQYNLISYTELGALSYQSGYQLAAKILKQEISAIVCASDTIALGVCKYLQEIERTDVQVCGIGNNSLLHFLFPNTISVDLGYKQGGEKAVNLLLSQLEQHHCKPQSLISPCELKFGHED